jgi:hypothetical protein
MRVRQPLQRPPVPRSIRLALILLPLVIVVLIPFWFVPWVLAARDAAREAQVENTFRQIEIALGNYHAYHKKFPTYYPSGEVPLPSQRWRVGLLPWFCIGRVAEDYAASEPWNSPRNQRFADSIRDLVVPRFRSPFSHNELSDFSDFIVVPPSDLPRLKSSGTRHIVVNVDNDQIIVAEQTNSTIHWMDPNGN